MSPDIVHRTPANRNKRCSDHPFGGEKTSQKGKKKTQHFGQRVPKCSCCVTRCSLHRLLRSCICGKGSQRVGCWGKKKKNPLILNKHAVATIAVGGSRRCRQIHLPFKSTLSSPNFVSNCEFKHEFLCKAACTLYFTALLRLA